MDEKSQIFFRYVGPVFSWALLIFVLSSVPGDRVPMVEVPFFDKAVHFFEYFLLGILTVRAIRRLWPGLAVLKISILAVGFATLYGFLDEWHQSFVPGRTAEWSDIVCDAVGALFGAWLFIRARKKMAPGEGGI